jgi:DNA primase
MALSPIEEIKNRLDLVEVISGYIKLKKAGANYRALCPFHSEKKPSFFVSPARQIWHCFGCNLGGNIFKFIMQIEGVEFGDALRILAQKAGVELKREDPKLKTQRQRAYEIYKLATKFFQKQLAESKKGLEAKKYLIEQRGITEESIRDWQLGYAPDTWRGLSDFLISQGYKREEVEKAGLSIRNQKGDIYDRFRGRIMFPIFDLNSQPVGFGGRIFQQLATESAAKYLNTPNTILYDKSKILYGLDKAKMEIRKQNFSILVEGYIDVILNHQIGFKNTIATSGTALTNYQLRILKRYSENILTAFDMDIAGDSATKRGIDLAQSYGFNIKVIVMPKERDPAAVISDSPEKWKKLVKDSKSILDFYFETTFDRFDEKTPQGKKEISKIILPVIKRIPNRIEQSHWIQKLSRKLEVREEDVLAEIQKIKAEAPEIEPEVEESSPQKSRKEKLEERLVAFLLKSPSNFSLISEKDLEYFSPQISQIIPYFQNKKGQEGKSGSKLPSELDHLVNYFLLKSEVEEIPEQDLDTEVRICLREIKCLGIKDKLSKIAQDIKKAEGEKDSSKLQELIKEFDSCSKSLQNLE